MTVIEPSHSMVMLTALAAGGLVLRLDSARCRVRFSLRAFLHTVRGELPVESGAIRFDPATGEAGGEVSADARRADTGNRLRDRVMHRRVLESAEHPRISFRPHELEGAIPEDGAADVRLSGELALHGGSWPVTVACEVVRSGGRVEAAGAFRVPFVAWGLRDPSMLMLRTAKHVEVAVQVRGELA